MFDKSTVTRLARDTVAATYPEGSKVRKAGNACDAVVGGHFVGFGVQHSQWKPESGVRFCINYGILPVKIFEANPAGRYNRKFKVTDPHMFARGRLIEDPSGNRLYWAGADPPEANAIADHWFLATTEAEFQNALGQINAFASRAWHDLFPEMLEPNWYRIQLTKMPPHPAVQVFIDVLA